MLWPTLLQYSDLGWLILRIAVGAVFLYHALPKLKNAKAMAGGMGMPAWFVSLLGLAELLGGVGVILGFWIQPAALLLAVVMAGALVMKVSKWNMPFSAMDKTGWEFDLVLLASALALLLGGGGSYTL